MLPLLVLRIFIATLILKAIFELAESPNKDNLWSPSTPITSLSSGDPAVVDALEPVWRKHRVPAITGGIVTSRGLERLGALGVRKTGTRVAVTTNDLWHLGSETKAMTAALAARLVERGLLRWNTTVAELFPELAGSLKSDMKRVTLEELLRHRGGIVGNLDWHDIAGSGSTVEQRLEALRAAMDKPRSSRDYHYSNLGYVVVGAMIEHVTGQSWEQAIQERLFAPLGMNSIGFGGTGTPGQTDQPWGHTRREQPVANNGPLVDNPPVLGPAGRVHASMADWARFLSDQLAGARGSGGLLRPESYAKIFEVPSEGEYALGWLVTERGWGGGTVYTHAGCNTMNYAVAWLAPDRDFGVFVCINQGDATAAVAADEAAGALIGMWMSTESAGQSTP
jgi:CubicO group peptidase (beta-lactamase class C family)